MKVLDATFLIDYGNEVDAAAVVAGDRDLYWSTERLIEFAPATSRRISIRASIDQYIPADAGGHTTITPD